MTTEIDLLPMPKPEGSGLYRAWSYDQMRDYARANVARAVAPLQAEIDALRTRLEDTVRDSTNKIEALRTEAEQHFQQAMSNGAKARAAQAQANNLRTEIEALRAEVDRVTRENEAMKRCAIRYLEWLGVTHVSLDQALYEDMHNPDMCGDAALTGHHNEVSND